MHARAILLAAALAITCTAAAVFDIVRTPGLAQQQSKQLAAELDELPAYGNAVRVDVRIAERLRGTTVTARFDLSRLRDAHVTGAGESLYSHYGRLLEARGWRECPRQTGTDVEIRSTATSPAFCRGEASAALGRPLFAGTPGWYEVSLDWSREKSGPWLVALGFLWTASLSTILLVPSVRDSVSITGISRQEAVLLATVPTIAISLANGAYLDAAYRLSPALFWMLDSLHYVSVPAITLWLLWRGIGIAPGHYGFVQVPGDALRSVTAYLLGALALPATFIIARHLVGVFLPVPGRVFGSVAVIELVNPFSYVTALPQEIWLRGLLILYFAVTAAIVEEIMFRGLPALYGSMMRDWGGARLIYYAVFPALFGLIHWENGRVEVVAGTIFGLVAAVFYERIRSLGPLILGHAITDIAAFVGLL